MILIFHEELKDRSISIYDVPFKVNVKSNQEAKYHLNNGFHAICGRSFNHNITSIESFS